MMHGCSAVGFAAATTLTGCMVQWESGAGPSLYDTGTLGSTLRSSESILGIHAKTMKPNPIQAWCAGRKSPRRPDKRIREEQYWHAPHQAASKNTPIIVLW